MRPDPPLPARVGYARLHLPVKNLEVHSVNTRRIMATHGLAHLLIVSVTISCLVAVCVCRGMSTPLCEVRVQGRSWPTPTLLVPRNSTVDINCTMNHSLPYWSIELASDGVPSERQFVDNGGQRTLLNAYGVYELTPIEIAGSPPVLRLLINDTETNNQTQIHCIGENGVFATTLIVFEPSPLTLEATEGESLHSLNISWSALPLMTAYDTKQIYELTVTHSHTQEWTILKLHEPYYMFSVPEDAPPCEVYNFSVSATYIGATYTGPSCSVPSPVLSRVLPSPPDITRLESSLNYTLQKRSGKIILLVSYLPAMYCEEYPVDNYSLVVEGVWPVGLPQATSELFSTENRLIADFLSEDTVYNFKVHAQNSVGKVSTKGVEIYTTDTQRVEIVELDHLDSVRIYCSFMTGSDARGCMVILMGELANVTMSLTREDDTVVAMATHRLPHALTCYHQVVAYDIESSGTVGTMTVPGILPRQINKREKCLPTKGTNLQGTTSATMSNLIAGILIPIVLLLVAITVVGVMVIVVQVKVKVWTRSSTPRALTSFEEKTADSEYCNPSEIPLYAVPKKSKKHAKTPEIRTAGDGAEKDTTEQELTITTKDCAGNYSPKWTKPPECLQGADTLVSYDKAVSPDPDAPELPPPFKPDLECSQVPHVVYDEIPVGHPPSEPYKDAKPPPVYQDILELSANRQKLELHSDKHNSPGSTKPLPVYEDIADLARARNTRKVPKASDNGKDSPRDSQYLLSVSVSETDSSIDTIEHLKPALPPKPPKGHHMTTLAKPKDDAVNLATSDSSELDCVKTVPIYQEIDNTLTTSDRFTLGNRNSNSSCISPCPLELATTHPKPSLNTPAEQLQDDFALPPPYEQIFPCDEATALGGGSVDIKTTPSGESLV